MNVSNDSVEAWLFDLILRREILGDYYESIKEITRICKSDDEYAVVKHLVENLIVLSSPQFAKQIDLLVASINKIGEKGDKEIAVVAMAWDDKPDSSQHLVQVLKSRFDRYSKVRLFNSVPSFCKKNNIETYPTYVLVDDFSGTGKTIDTRLAYIEKAAEARGVATDPHACILFGMEKAYTNLAAKWPNSIFCTTLKPGLSGYFSGQELEDKVANVKRLEEELAPIIDETTMPSLGHGQAEALFFIKEMNAPNSNFPIFWWPEDANGEKRVTLMNRSEL
jgi:hypothetical protein